jgi:hypothetical protein
MNSQARPLGVMGTLVLAWSLSGVTAILALAIIRLSPKVAGAFAQDLSPLHWVFAIGFTLFMLYTEAWRGFHKKFSPRTIARAVHVSRDGSLLQRLLAPLFSMGFFHATKRRVIATWILTITIVTAVVLMHQLAQPWRGLIDLGVVVGLGAGIATLFVEALRVARGGAPVDPELP